MHLDDPSKSKSPATTRDSAGACRDRATADLLASVTMLTANQRLRLENSAASWAQRAEMLQRVEDSVAKRRAAA